MYGIIFKLKMDPSKFYAVEINTVLL